MGGPRIKINVGDTFDRWTIVANNGDVDNAGKTMLLCKCACGTMRLVRQYTLHQGKTSSCGCLNREVTSKSNRTHGLYYHPLYTVWRGMRQRCLQPNSTNYPHYGGRGITIDPRWTGKNGFMSFFNDMHPTYRPGLTLERREVDGNYTPDNCTWATVREQANNRRNNHFIVDPETGVDITLAELGRKHNFVPSLLKERLRRGVSGMALIAPVRTLGRNFEDDLTDEADVDDAPEDYFD